MNKDGSFKTVIQRHQKALRLRPSIGIGTAATTARIRAGSSTCDLDDGKWKLVADESEGDGGAGLGPDPGVFGRAALASCLAIGYIMWADYFGVPIDEVEVVVEADYNASGLFGVDDSIPPRWSAMRYTARISSGAPEQKVREMVEYADRHSSLLYAFRDAIPVSGEVEIKATVGG
jgi:uncharacterized OsmC-like protein